jgi:sterol desaturase/sphingolipid hydroxylase (fatty acid hydroxylase superfamily)
MDWLLQSIPAFAVAASFVVAERLVRAPRTDWVINLFAWALYVMVGASAVKLVGSWEGPALIDGRDLPGWAAVVISVLVVDLLDYVYHRLQHRIPILWAMHSLHHSDPEMSTLTTQRHFWADPPIKALTIWSLGAMIIAPTAAAIAVYGLLSLWNFLTHSRLRIDLGWWSWVINTPAYHRRHHSRLSEHYDSNFAALFPIWDVLFGSYYRPDGFPPTGLDFRPRKASDVLLWPLVWYRAHHKQALGDRSGVVTG